MKHWLVTFAARESRIFAATATATDENEIGSPIFTIYLARYNCESFKVSVRRHRTNDFEERA